MADNRNGNITDLTEDEEEAGAAKEKKKPEKKQKPPKPAKPDKAKPGKKGKDGAKKKSAKPKLIIIAVLLLLIGGFVAALIFNLFGIRAIVSGVVQEPVINAVAWLDPEFSTVEETLRQSNDERVAELDKREEELNKREEEITVREGNANEREVQLDKRRDALDKREESLKQEQQAAKEPAYRRELTEDEIESLQSLSRSYANMAPEAAAKILAELHKPEDAAVIIYHMSERGAAAVLAAMETALAARITEMLLQAG